MAAGSMESKGFLAALFDFGFTSFITLKFLRAIYASVVILILCAAAIAAIAGFAALAQGDAFGIILVIGAPVIALIYLVLTRISMEMIALFFRIGENTSIMAANSTGQVPPTAPGYGSSPFGGPSGPDYGPAPMGPPSGPIYPAV
jgi:hypothetical protein